MQVPAPTTSLNVLSSIAGQPLGSSSLDLTAHPSRSWLPLMDLPAALVECIVVHCSRHQLQLLAHTCKQLRQAVLHTASRLVLDTSHLDGSERSLVNVVAVLGRAKPITHLTIKCASEPSLSHLAAVERSLAARGGSMAVRHTLTLVWCKKEASHPHAVLAALGPAFPAITRLHLEDEWHLTPDTPLWTSLAACTRLADLALSRDVHLEPGQPLATIAASLPHVRCLEDLKFSKSIGSMEVLRALGPQLTKLCTNLFAWDDEAMAAVGACHRLQRIRLQKLSKEVLSSLVTLPALTHVYCDILGWVRTDPAESMSCSWEVLQVQQVLGPGQGLEPIVPRGMHQLIINSLHLDFHSTQAKTEAGVREFGTQLQAAARSVRFDQGKLVLVVSDWRQHDKANIMCGLLRGLRPLAGSFHSLHLCNPFRGCQLHPAHILALGDAVGCCLTHLELNHTLPLDPAAWAVLPAALPALQSFTMHIRSSHGSNSSFGGQDCPLDPACVSALVRLCTDHPEQALEVTLVGKEALGRQVVALQPRLAGSRVWVRHRRR